MERKRALKFVLLLGLVSLLADVTYEGARSIIGPYLAILGASGTVVGVVAGLGELVGYALRLIFGYLTDLTRRYWSITFVGYTLNLITVPLLALASSWPVAALLVVGERLGKAIRTPARDALLSYATKDIGRGWGFGIHEAMDRVGALLGPLGLSLLLFFHYSYQTCFLWLAIPAALALLTLAKTSLLYPSPEKLEVSHPSLKAEGLSTTFWIYLVGVGMIAAGYVDFPLVAYHFQKAHTVSSVSIPLLYAIAMAIGAVASLLLGRLFDTHGRLVMISSMSAAAFAAPLLFWGNLVSVLIGIFLWGIGIGVQGSVLRAVVAELVHTERRATAYGIFNVGFGISWFLGSSLMGVLYDYWLGGLVGFSVCVQLLALPILWIALRRPQPL